MLTERTSNILQVTFSLSKQTKFSYGKLPVDFFNSLGSLKIRRSLSLSSKKQVTDKKSSKIDHQRSKRIQSQHKINNFVFKERKKVKDENRIKENPMFNKTERFKHNLMLKEAPRDFNSQLNQLISQLPPLKNKRIFNF